jgi:hypothetical protein
MATGTSGSRKSVAAMLKGEDGDCAVILIIAETGSRLQAQSA